MTPRHSPIRGVTTKEWKAVVNLMKAYVFKFGVQAAREIVFSFGVERVRELSPKQFIEFKAVLLAQFNQRRKSA